jgi:hypothetical protein
MDGNIVAQMVSLVAFIAHTGAASSGQYLFSFISPQEMTSKSLSRNQFRHNAECPDTIPHRPIATLALARHSAFMPLSQPQEFLQ